MNLSRATASLRTALLAFRSPGSRQILLEAWRLERALPRWLDSLSLPELMRHLDREAAAGAAAMNDEAVTRLADAAAALDYPSPLGLCLRRSLVRYVLLRRAGVPVVVHFGAKKTGVHERSRLAGHAWLSLNGRPFAESPEDYQGFAIVYSYPNQDEGRRTQDHSV